MRKVLMAFLGKGPYQETTYQIEKKQYKSQLAFVPIRDHFSPIDTTYIIGTKESKWDLIKEIDHVPIHIPYGRSESDFWQMFDILKDKMVLKQADLIFDVTHCFRAIPIFTVIYIRLLKYLEPTAHFTHIFYGSYEKGHAVTPIVDLASTLDLLDWIDATTSFIKYGELEELSIKLKTAHDTAWKNDANGKPAVLGEFSKRLARLSDLSRLTYVPLLSEASKQISELLNKTELGNEINRYVKPFGLLSGELLRYTTRFQKPSLWEAHLEAAKWYVENQRPTQALLVLREVILTCHCEKDGCDPYDIKSREKREEELNEKRKKSKEPVVKLWQKITDARNIAGHALMKRFDKDLSPGKAIKKVKALIEETEKILGGQFG